MGKIVSIIIPTKNEMENISNLLSSLERQDYRPIEAVFVDGGSTDGTLEAIEQMKLAADGNNYIIKLLRESDFGECRSPANARNIGISSSTGECLVFIDADMILSDSHFITAVKSGLDANKWVSVKSEIIIDNVFERSVAAILAIQNEGDVHLFCGVRRELFAERKFDVTLGYGEDRDFFINYLERKMSIKPLLVNATLQRHEPHNLKEYTRQQVWYSRTLLRYSLKNASVLQTMRIVFGPLLFPLSLLACALLSLVNAFYGSAWVSLATLAFGIVCIMSLSRVGLQLLRVPPNLKKSGVAIRVTIISLFIRPFCRLLGLLQLGR